MRNAWPGEGFSGKTSNALTVGYSTGVTISFPEPCDPEETMAVFKERLSFEDLQLNIIGINIQRMIERILKPVMVFKSGIFDLKITEIQGQHCISIQDYCMQQ
jgi:hypothetical protein